MSISNYSATVESGSEAGMTNLDFGVNIWSWDSCFVSKIFNTPKMITTRSRSCRNKPVTRLILNFRNYQAVCSVCVWNKRELYVISYLNLMTQLKILYIWLVPKSDVSAPLSVSALVTRLRTQCNPSSRKLCLWKQKQVCCKPFV